MSKRWCAADASSCFDDDCPKHGDPWLADIVRCAEASFTRWKEGHRSEETGALVFVGGDGPFYEGMRSVVDRLRDYHYEKTRRENRP